MNSACFGCDLSTGSLLSGLTTEPRSQAKRPLSLFSLFTARFADANQKDFLFYKGRLIRL